MKKLTFLLVLLITSEIIAQNSETRRLSYFNEVSAQEGIDVYMKKGSSESADIEARGIDLDEVLLDISGDRLKIHLEGDNHRNTDVIVRLTYTELVGLDVSSAASIEVQDQVVAKDFELEASSAGDLELDLVAENVEMDVSSSGDIDVKADFDELDARVSSAGDINISGKVNILEVNASSSGDFDGLDLDCKEAELSASSGASIKAGVSKKLRARASSGGSVRYRGNPEWVDRSSSSGGSVRGS